MKKLTYSALAVFFGMFLLASCNGGGSGSANVEEDILGEWKVEAVDLSSIEDMVEQMAQSMGITGDDLQQMKDEMKDEMQGEFDDETITFNEDYTVHMSDGEDATWSYDSDNNKIIIATPDGQNIDFVIEELKGDKLKARFIVSEAGMSMDIGMDLVRQ
ncbi:MAG: lipocalin family protein [Bacteroidales bacterium]|nr:lipocalin family protein [Bacteroidales bacterium]